VSADGIVAIEWAERWRDRPDGEGVVEVRLADEGEDRRRIEITRSGSSAPPS
jgi:tRNA A37 threonylcarbamoyladenosine biosynthesis protein TsaE